MRFYKLEVVVFRMYGAQGSDTWRLGPDRRPLNFSEDGWRPIVDVEEHAPANIP